MRFSFLILFTLFSAEAWGAKWLSEQGLNDLQAGKKGVVIFGSQQPCEQRFQATCYDVTGLDLGIISIITTTEKDPTKPIYEAPSNVTPCAGNAACVAVINDDAFCPDGLFGRYDGTEAWCTKILGYETQSTTGPEVDPAKLAAREARLGDKDEAFDRLMATGLDDISSANNINSLKPILTDMLKVILGKGK